MKPDTQVLSCLTDSFKNLVFICFAYSNFRGKSDVILLLNSAFREFQVLIELIFRYTFISVYSY